MRVTAVFDDVAGYDPDHNPYLNENTITSNSYGRHGLLRHSGVI